MFCVSSLQCDRLFMVTDGGFPSHTHLFLGNKGTPRLLDRANANKMFITNNYVTVLKSRGKHALADDNCN